MALTTGARLGPYEILASLGVGGMGEVYRARDARLNREVAIKVVPPEFSCDPGRLKRFEKEAQAASALNHPNIVTIYEIGSSDSTSWIAMELVEGKTLRELLFSGPLPIKRALSVAAQMAEGLARAHGEGIVHRDLKPENVMMTRDGLVKILDFGIAKLTATASGSDRASRLPTETGTSPGVVLGTAGYMSPEQVRGLAVDHRSDIFSFGTILYELLSGKRAFKRDTTAETMAAIMLQEPPELSESGRKIPVALDHIVKHCLEKDRDNRFQTAKDVVFALSEASSPTAATNGERPVAPAAGKSRVLIAAAVIAVLAVAGVFLLRRSHQGPGKSAGVKRLAVLPFENLGAAEDDYFVDGIADEVRGKLTSIQGLQVIARGSSTPYKKTDKTPRQIALELNASYLLTATVRWDKSGGSSHVHVSPELVDATRPDAPTSRWQKPFDAALTDVFQVQSDIASRVAHALGVAIGADEEKRLAEKPTQNLAAYDAFLKGEQALKAPTLDSGRRALPFYEQAVALDPGFAHAWSRVSTTTSILYGWAPTPLMAERARQAAEKAVALAPDRPEGYLALGFYYRRVAEDSSRALEEYSKGRRVEPGDAALLTYTGDAEMTLGRWDAAVQHLEQAERLDPRAVQTLSVNSKSFLGTAFVFLRRYPEAREALDRGLAFKPDDLFIVSMKAMTLLAEGDLSGARAVLKAASTEVEPTALAASVGLFYDLMWVLDEEQRELLLRLTPSAFGDDKASWAFTLAQACALKGDAANLRKYAEQARIAIEERLRSAPNDGLWRTALGFCLAYLGRKEEAIREGMHGAALYPVSKDAVDGPYVQHLLARIYILVGEPEKAIDTLEPLLKMPSYLSPGWLRIDPNFDPLRKNPRFEKLAAGAK